MATMVGCNQSGILFKIDPSTGVGSQIGPIGFATTNSLARNKHGVLYSVPLPGLVITINPTTGAGTFVANLTPTADIRGLAFSPTDVLFGLRDGGDTTTGGSTSENPDDLVTIDLITGAVTLVGTTGLSAIQALEFSASGILFGWDLSYGLVTINPLTGAATRVNPNLGPGGLTDIQSIAFAPDGTLYGAREALYRIDPNTSATTLVGSGGYTDVRGIEFLRSIVRRPRPWAITIVRLAWAWMFWVGYVLITPIGPICAVCGTPLSEAAARILGAITLVIALAGLLSTTRARSRSD